MTKIKVYSFVTKKTVVLDEKVALALIKMKRAKLAEEPQKPVEEKQEIQDNEEKPKRKYTRRKVEDSEETVED